MASMTRRIHRAQPRTGKRPRVRAQAGSARRDCGSCAYICSPGSLQHSRAAELQLQSRIRKAAAPAASHLPLIDHQVVYYSARQSSAGSILSGAPGERSERVCKVRGRTPATGWRPWKWHSINPERRTRTAACRHGATFVAQVQLGGSIGISNRGKEPLMSSRRQRRTLVFAVRGVGCAFQVAFQAPTIDNFRVETPVGANPETRQLAPSQELVDGRRMHAKIRRQLLDRHHPRHIVVAFVGRHDLTH